MEISLFALGVLVWIMRTSNRSDEVQKYASVVTLISKWMFIFIACLVVIGGVFGVGFVEALKQAKDGMAIWGAIEIGIYIYLQGVKKETL